MQVEIWADIACPWCYIGRARFESALAAFEHRDEVTVTWRAFELDAQAPAERAGERLEHLAAKIGASVEETRAMEERVADLARAEGLPVDFATVRDGNTFDAHRVARLAATHGRQDAMEDRLMRARFGEGALVSDHDTLVRLATEVGLPEDEVRELLASGRLGDEVL